jgi:hypothetical protein
MMISPAHPYLINLDRALKRPDTISASSTCAQSMTATRLNSTLFNK